MRMLCGNIPQKVGECLNMSSFNAFQIAIVFPPNLILHIILVSIGFFLKSDVVICFHPISIFQD